MAKPVYSREDYDNSDRKLKILYVGKFRGLISMLDAAAEAQVQIEASNRIFEEELKRSGGS